MIRIMILTIIVSLHLSSCIQAKQRSFEQIRKQDIGKKQAEIDKIFISDSIRQPLNIEPNLTKVEKQKISNIANEFNDIAKHFAYQEHFLDLNNTMKKKYCSKLIELYKNLSTRSISRERERERGRVYQLGTSICSFYEDSKEYTDSFVLTKDAFSSQIKVEILTKGEWQKIHQEIPDSAQALISLAWRETNPEESLKLFKQALKADPQDLMTYKDLDKFWKPDFERFMSRSEKEAYLKQYCQKAAELKQWDHIFYLTTEGVDSVRLGPDDDSCKEAYKLVELHWSIDYKMRHAE